jgi:hypothetical protein
MVLGNGAGDGLGGETVRRSGEGRARRAMSTVGFGRCGRRGQTVQRECRRVTGVEPWH